eukprot:GHVL01012097.1.p1 GENE.GHVL01012097.1~~GHVL01012097.1.p1  ORF type:complete len:324 (-),score=40.80 GHVL01012097.1:48-1019(-)
MAEQDGKWEEWNDLSFKPKLHVLEDSFDGVMCEKKLLNFNQKYWDGLLIASNEHISKEALKLKFHGLFKLLKKTDDNKDSSLIEDVYEQIRVIKENIDLGDQLNLIHYSEAIWDEIETTFKGLFQAQREPDCETITSKLCDITMQTIQMAAAIRSIGPQIQAIEKKKIEKAEMSLVHCVHFLKSIRKFMLHTLPRFDILTSKLPSNGNQQEWKVSFRNELQRCAHSEIHDPLLSMMNYDNLSLLKEWMKHFSMLHDLTKQLGETKQVVLSAHSENCSRPRMLELLSAFESHKTKSTAVYDYLMAFIKNLEWYHSIKNTRFAVY